ncbi:MAG: ubiquinol-cytochrome C chaperone family protein [Inquilinaceae bacterium]
MFARLLRPRTERAAAAQLYLTLVEQARHPDFYARWGVPDTTTGRFDLIALHAFLVMHRLKAAGTAGLDMSQALFDYMFADMDLSLREMGVGDLSVGKKIKKMAEGFNGRATAFEEALGDPPLLREALTRNLFGSATPPASNVDAIGRYVEREVAALSGQPDRDLLAGTVTFGPPPEPADRAADEGGARHDGT